MDVEISFVATKNVAPLTKNVAKKEKLKFTSEDILFCHKLYSVLESKRLVKKTIRNEFSRIIDKMG